MSKSFKALIVIIAVVIYIFTLAFTDMNRYYHIALFIVLFISINLMIRKKS